MSNNPVTRFSVPGFILQLDWSQRALVGLAGLGVLDAGYLVWVKLADSDGLCAGLGDCAAVNTSVYSEMFGAPIAAFGLALYLTILALLVMETRQPGTRGWGELSIFGLSLAGMIYSTWLTYVEAAILRAICPFCVASAVLITAILVVSTVRVVRHAAAD